MRIHLLSLPHTITRAEFTHCAYTGKVIRFSPMMRSVGYEVIHYGVEGAVSGANEQVDLMTQAEQEKLLGYTHKEHIEGTKFVGDGGNTANPAYIEFNRRLIPEIKARYKPGDFVALPFGYSSNDALRAAGISYDWWVETGVGYLDITTRWAIFESYTVLHYYLGKRNENGSDYQWVIPNYFDVSEWKPNYNKDGYVLYFGRLGDIKGLPIVVELAKQRPDLHFILCGQGNPSPYLVAPNIEYHPPIYGPNRSALYEGARVILMPTRYVEAFGGVNVEAQLCGKPVLASNFGVFNETIEDGVTGFLCNTLGDYLKGLELVSELDGHYIRNRAVEKYDMYNLAHKYNNVFEQINDVLTSNGWFSTRSRLKVKTPFTFKSTVSYSPKKKYVWFSRIPGWSVDSQEVPIRKYLDESGDEILRLNWADTYSQELIDSYIKDGYIFVTPNAGLHGLVAYYNVPPNKIINIQHDDYSLAWTLYRLGIKQGREIFNSLYKFGVVAPSITTTAISFGITKLPKLLKSGIFVNKYTPKQRKEIRTLGYAQSYNRYVFTDTDLSVPDLDVKRGNLIEEVAFRTSLPVKWATGPIPEEGRKSNTGPYFPILGTPGGEEMNKFYQDIDLLLMPSLIEGGPLAPFEAAACGIPTIGTRTGWFHEFAASGAGILVSHDNFVNDAVSKIQELIDNPNKYISLCNSSLNKIQEFDWENVLPIWVKFFNE